MYETLEALIDEHGQVHLLRPVRLASPRRALVTILEEGSLSSLGEPALIDDWSRPEEDAAWSHLQRGR